MEELLTTKQVAERLQVHLITVYRWIAQGLLPAQRLPGGWLRIEAKELDKLLGENKGRTNVKSRR